VAVRSLSFDGAFSSVISGSDGLPLVAVFDSNNNDLKAVHCADAVCSSATTTVLNSTGNVGRYPSVTVGADGLGLVSYLDATNSNLKVAHCANLACSTFTTSTVDASGKVGDSQTSLTVGTDGLGLISYYDGTSGDLDVAHCSNLACSSATTTAMDSTNDVGRSSSVAIGADGLGLVSCSDLTNTRLRVAHCSSLAIGADGLPLVSYRDVSGTAVKVAHCPNVFCVGYLRRQ
jgi:hypothetical protein